MVQIFETPEEVAKYLGSAGTGMPPPYAGTGQYVREGGFGGPIIEGALLALDGDDEMARAQSLYVLQGNGSPEVLERTLLILEEPPVWWNKTDPDRGGTFGERFLSMATYGEAARREELARKMIERSKGTAVEGEVYRAVAAWRPKWLSA
jgi:hypothetical protein